MEPIRHELNGYRIPAYMEEILTHNYCPYFVRMSMVRDGESYRFSYRPGRMMKMNIQKMDIYDKIMLLRSLITINEAAEGYLIKAENYLLEPELIYTADGSMLHRKIRIMFYPDVKRIGFARKLMQFSERIRNDAARDEREVFTQIRELLERGDVNRLRMLLDKNLQRYESGTLRTA